VLGWWSYIGGIGSLLFRVVFNGDDDGRSCVCVFGRLGEYRGVSLRAWVLFREKHSWESLFCVSRLRVFTLRAEIEKRVLDFGRS